MSPLKKQVNCCGNLPQLPPTPWEEQRRRHEKGRADLPSLYPGCGAAPHLSLSVTQGEGNAEVPCIEDPTYMVPGFVESQEGLPTGLERTHLVGNDNTTARRSQASPQELAALEDNSSVPDRDRKQDPESAHLVKETADKRNWNTSCRLIDGRSPKMEKEEVNAIRDPDKADFLVLGIVLQSRKMFTQTTLMLLSQLLCKSQVSSKLNKKI